MQIKISEPIRVLHVVGDLGVGGIQLFLLNLYKNIDRTKVQFDFVVHMGAKESYDNEITRLGGSIFYVDNNAFERRNWFVYLKFWKTFFKKHPEYKIVHGHMRSTIAIYLTAAKMAGCFTIAHSHNTTNGYEKSAKIKNIVQLPARFVADYCMGCSNRANEWMFGKKKALSHKCCVIHNGIDVTRYTFNLQIRNKLRNELKLKDDFVIGNVGRLVQQKNQQMILAAFKLLQSEIPQSRLLMIGDGPLLEQLQLQAKEFEIADKVLFLGSRDDVPELLQAIDVFTLSSLNEGLGIVVIEAQAAGLPTIVSRAVPEEAFITNLCEYVEESTVKSWAESIKKKQNVGRQDTEATIRKAGYDIQTIADWLCNFYMNHTR